MNPQNIILIRPDHLGDLILSLPVAQVLKDRFPTCNITYLVAPGPAEIAPMVKCVDDWIIDTDINGRLGPFKLAQVFRNGNFDILIELKPAWRTAVAGFLSQIPIRIGTRRRFYSFLYNKPQNLHRRGSSRHQSDLDLALLKSLGISISGIVPSLTLPDRYKLAVKRLVGESIKEYIVIHPGSGGSAPNWPMKYYRELAILILKETKLNVIITGVETDLGDFEGCFNLCGKTNLLELAGILSDASLFVSGSTGPLHLADALGTKSLAFFPRHEDIDDKRWGPRRHPEGIMVPLSDKCQSPNVADCRCLEQITPRDAFNRMNLVLNSKTNGKSVSL